MKSKLIIFLILPVFLMILFANNAFAFLDLKITSDHKNFTTKNPTLTFEWKALVDNTYKPPNTTDYYYQLSYKISTTFPNNPTLPASIYSFVEAGPKKVDPEIYNLSGISSGTVSIDLRDTFWKDTINEGKIYLSYVLKYISKNDFTSGNLNWQVYMSYPGDPRPYTNGTDSIGYEEFNIDFIPPTDPSNLRTQLSNNTLNASWDPSTDKSKVTYYYLIDTNQKTAKEIIAANNTTYVTYVSIPFTPQGNFYFNLVAVDEAGNTSPVVSQLCLKDITPPTITINGSSTEIEVSYYIKTIVLTTEVKDSNSGISMFLTNYTMSNDIKPVQTTILTQETYKRWKLQFIYNLPIGQHIFTVQTKDLANNQSSLKQIINILPGITDITITSPTNHIKDSWSSKIPAEFNYNAQLATGAQMATKPYFYLVTKTPRTSQQIIDEVKKKESTINVNSPVFIANTYDNAETLYGATALTTIQYFDPQKNIQFIGSSPYNGQWYLYVVAKDSQGGYFAKEHKFGIDTEKPTGSIKIEGGKPYTNKSKVTLDLAASALSGIDTMTLLNETDPFGTPVPYKNPYTWDLSGGEGPKTVKVMYTNKIGNTSSLYSANIGVDTTPPTVSANIPRYLYIKNKGIISWEAEDTGAAPSGLGETQVIKSTIFGGRPIPVTFQTVKEGEKSFIFENMPEDKLDFRLDIYDKAGNYAILQYKNRYYYTLVVDRTPPLWDMTKSNIKVEGALEDNNRFIIGSKEFTLKWAPGTDNLSGIKEYTIQYKREGEPDTVYALPDRTLLNIAFDQNKNEYAEKITLPYEGNFLFRINAIDKCGNISNITSKLIEIDSNTLIQKFSLTEYPQAPNYKIDFELALNSNLSQFFWLYLEGNPQPLDSGSGTTSSKSFENIITPITEGKYKFTLKILDKKNQTTTVEKYVTLDTTPPNAIDTIKAYADSSKKDIVEENKPYGYENPYFEWVAPADTLSGIQGYLVGLPEDINKEPTDPITEAKYQAKGLVSGKTYYLNVKALDKAGLASKIKTFTYNMPQPEKISIQDKGISIVRNAKFTFSAKAYDNKNQEIIGYASFSWEKTEGEGSINKDTGEFTASNTLGKVKIKAASDNGKTDEIEINITEEPVKLEIDPSQGAKTATDQSFTFTVVGKDAANNTVIINPIWSASPAPASIQASGNKGIFSANQKGTYTVIAQYNQLKASANIEVFQADHTPPEAFNLLEPSNQKRINKEGSLTLKWELTKDDPNGSGMDKYEVILNGTKIGENDVKTNTYTIPAKDLKDGTFTWTIAALDKLGNKREASPFTFIVNIKGPAITVKIDNREVNNGDIINANPKFTIELQDPNGVKKDSIKLTLNGKVVSQGLSIQSASGASDSNIVAAYTPAEKLAEGKNTLYIEAYDTENYKTEREIKDLTVMAGLSIIGSPRNYPNPFKPSSNESTNIVYTLSQDAEITIYLYNIAGEQVWRLTLLPGQEGAHANENTVSWNGKDFSNEIVANGVYLMAITSGGKVLARGEIAVYE